MNASKRNVKFSKSKEKHDDSYRLLFIDSYRSRECAHKYGKSQVAELIETTTLYCCGAAV